MIFSIEFPEALRKPLDLLNSNVRGARGKKRRKSILMPRLLPFTFCFLLFAAQLPLCLFRLPQLFPTPAARDRPDRTRQTRRDQTAPPASDRFCRPPEPLLFFATVSFFAPLSLHQNRVSGAKSAPLTFEYNRSSCFFRAFGQSRLITFIPVFSPEGFWFHFGKIGASD